MKRNFIRSITLLLSLFFLAQCAKDKGNYDLGSTNEILIDSLNGGQNIDILIGDKLTITPKFNQENTATGQGNYRFRWFMFGDNSNRTATIELSDQQDLDIEFNYPIGGYELMLTITDLKTNIGTTQNIHVTVSSKFTSGLVVVDQKGSGADISHIGFDGTIYRNQYSLANNQSISDPNSTLSGFFFVNGQKIQKPISIYLNSKGHNSIELDPETYKEVGPFSRLMNNPPSEPVEVADVKGMFSGDQLFAIVNGKVQLGPGGNGNTSPSFIGELLGDYEAAPFIISTTNGAIEYIPAQTILIVYDQKQGRFLHFSGSQIGQLNGYSTDMSDAGAFNPNNVKKKCVFSYYSNQYAYYNWIMRDDAGKMYFYQLYPTPLQSAASSYFEIPASAQMDKATAFAGSTKLPQIYYVLNNEVFIYDYKANSSRLIYSFPGTEKITEIKFAVSRVPNYMTEYRVERTLDQLYIATYNGSEGKVNEFEVSASGELKLKQSYGGFGKINSIFYKEKQ